MTRSSLRTVRLQVPAEFGVADKSTLAQINGPRLIVVSDWRAMIPSGVSASAVVPIGADSQDVIEVPFADHAESNQDLVLERLDDPLDKRLEIRCANRRELHGATIPCEDVVKCLHVLRVSVTPTRSLVSQGRVDKVFDQITNQALKTHHDRSSGHVRASVYQASSSRQKMSS